MLKLMTKILKPFAVAVFSVMLACCDQHREEIHMGGADLLIEASGTEAKTYLSGGLLKWTSGDVIRVFAEDGTMMLSSPVPSAASTYDFTVSDWPSEKTPEYAVFCGPADVKEEPSFSDGIFTLSVNSTQVITHNNSFAKNANISVAKLIKKPNGTYAALMRNVCGLIGFTFDKYEDVESVVIEDIDGNPLSGKVAVVMDENGEPYVTSAVNGSSSVMVKANPNSPSLGNINNEMPKGRGFYVCILPGSYVLKVSINRLNGESYVLTANSKCTIDRSSIIELGAIDNLDPKDFSALLTNESYSEYTPQSDLPLHIDFSRVGYHWGEDDIPDLPVAVTLTAPADGSDMTQTIQDAINSVTSGAVLLKSGTYNVSGEIVISSDNVVLRGEGNNTVIVAKGSSKFNAKGTERVLINVGNPVERTYGFSSRIVENVPLGQMWVRVANPESFIPGENVALYRPGTDEWISDLRMDQIPQNAENSVKQWTASYYKLYWERKVVEVKNDIVYLDNPVVMSLTDDYGVNNRGYLCKVTCNRVRECGVENMKLISEYDPSEMDADGNHIDEDHCWSAIFVYAAEHCWVRNISTENFGYSSVNLRTGARHITVSDCESKHPVSEITGSRRYAYHISGGECSLVKNCLAEEDRHGFVTGIKVAGPNVFLSCNMVGAKSDVGPHQRWATGVLYDNQYTDGLLAVQDGCNNGTGHGWRGSNFILWNCTAKTLVCQNPWVTGRNWCVGCIGEKNAGRRKDRPDGEWRSHGAPVSPQSLYEWQLQNRLDEGNRLTRLL